ncbi:uncharacterized protein si:dkey-225f5.4 isoform X1 [Neolamprologus brichardi]|uniref:uncharacterized protein si:dkey-225f5.4 isoform X1 n=1 Tax=Neolamprologus brichardi TaxID=32507 RepID=UPI0003EC558E|nr:uncharacterized protein si:dkey-225f5.4 isoform X1 [Neolamprologus brichardi]
MAAVRAVLRRCDPALLEPRGEPEPDCDQAARMVLFLTDRRRMQKVLWRQLFVLDSMMSLLEGLESAQQLMTQSCPPQPEGGARGRWKALKVESRSGVEETEALLRSLQDRIQQIHDRRHTLTQLAQHLHSKRQQSEQLESSLLNAQNALQSCDLQLAQLRAESEVTLGHLIEWQRLRDELQVHVSATQDVMHINLLAFNQSELCVELRPHTSSGLLSNELEPLRLSVTWSHDDRFRLQVRTQVSEGTAGLAEDSLTGRRVELSAALLEVMRCYVGQAELLAEIQSLRSSFAIDWHPAQRLLVYLKTASLVCHLEVEEGYPRVGRARLLSVRRDGQHVDTSGLKPPSGELRLTEWLVFLYSSPLL